MALNNAQQAQVRMQLERHKQIKSGLHEMVLDESGRKTQLWISRGDFGSHLMGGSIYLARFLDACSELFSGKVCLDMGCGPGTMGLIMGGSAKEVDFADINPIAVKDVRKNVQIHGLGGISRVYPAGDLFEHIPSNRSYDVIVFNHPFFPEEPENFGADVCPDIRIRRTMLGGNSVLLNRFYVEMIRQHRLNHNGMVFDAYFDLAGPKNDPERVSKDYGFKTLVKEVIKPKDGLQRKGNISVYVLGRKDEHK